MLQEWRHGRPILQQQANMLENSSGRVRRQGYSYQKTARIEYSFQRQEENGDVYQLQRNSRVSRPGYSRQHTGRPEDSLFQQEGYPDQETTTTTTTTYQHQKNSRIIRKRCSCQQGNISGYSYNLANDRDRYEARRQVPVSKTKQTNNRTSRMSLYIQQSSPERNELGPPRRSRMPEFSNGGIRLPQIRQRTGIQEHSESQSFVAGRRCGRQEVCEKPNWRQVKRNGVCQNSDATQKQLIFVRVLAKRF